MKRAVGLTLTALTAAVTASAAHAGAYVAYAGAPPETRMHPHGYNGVGGSVEPIRVCLDTAVNTATALAAEASLQKAIATVNRLRPLSRHTYALGADTDVPAGKMDFESVLLHELMHAVGLGHPNLADESGLGGPFDDATQSARGPNGVFDTNPGPDGLYGSPDDVRGDDVNRHWYQRYVNDPGRMPVQVDTTTMTPVLDALPPGHAYAANADRRVLAALGYADAEAVAQQGARADEAQRHLQDDDVATIRLARSGFDGVAGTGDDYVWSLVYFGRRLSPPGEECQISVRFDDTTSFASTALGSVGYGANQLMLYTARTRFNPNVDWYFSPGPNTRTTIVSHVAAGADAPIVVRARVAKADGNPIAALPRGDVEVRDGARDAADTATCTITLAGTPDEIGECALTPRRSGAKTLVADYLGYGGFDASTASVAHDAAGSVQFGDVTVTPAPSAIGAPADVRWTLASASGTPAAPTGTVIVKDAPDCASPPADPANTCSATLPANTCAIRFATAGSKTLRLCYSGDGTYAAVAAGVPHDVLAARATQTTIVGHTPDPALPFAPVRIRVSVRETPDLGGFPAGVVDVRDGPDGDATTATCRAMLTGTPGEIAECDLYPLVSGTRTVTAAYAAQRLWAASDTTTAASVGRFAIAHQSPRTSRRGQGVSVAVAVDVAPFRGTPAPTGTITVGDGVDHCQIVLPARECLWTGNTVGMRSLAATWPGDANYAARTSEPVVQNVVADSYPQLVSVSRAGAADSDGNSSGSAVAISGDGRYVAFLSDASTLVDDDTNGATDVFVRDRANGTVRRVGTGAFGEQANGPALAVAISANGRYVAFSSTASNLVGGDTNGIPDVFVKDLATGAIERVSLAEDGRENFTWDPANAMAPSLSADGRYVAFPCSGRLTANDRNVFDDAYVRDRLTGKIELVSSDDADRAGSFRTFYPTISADGRYVAMLSQSFNFAPIDDNSATDVYVKDRVTRTMRRASASAAGVIADYHSNGRPVLSADGRYVAFRSLARNLVVPNDPNLTYDVFVKDMQTGAVEQIDGVPVGGPAGTGPGAPSISADGRYVTYEATLYQPVQRNEVYRKDRQTGLLSRLNLGPGGVASVAGDSVNTAVSADGRYVAFQSAATTLVAGDRNGATDVFVRDVVAGTTERISEATGGTRADGDSAAASLSQDGRYVVFDSAATGLVAGDTNGARDVFVHDRDSGAITRVDADGAAGNGDSDSPSISADGTWIAFRSAATNLVAGDTNGRADIFAVQRATGAVYRMSTSSSGGAITTGAVSGPTSVARNGSAIVFRASDTTLVPGDTNGVDDVFAKLAGGATVLVSADAAGVIGNGASADGFVSDDGARVAFASDATNLVAGDTNGVRDVFVKTLASGAIVRASADAAGAQANGASGEPALSADGGYVAFASAATNLVANDTNGSRDIFVKHLATGAVERVSTNAAGQQGAGGDCGTPSLSRDARYVGFVCAQTNLVAGDDNGVADAFVKDRTTGAIVRVSQNQSGAAANAASTTTAQALSDNGYAAFASAADNLVVGDTQRIADVFVARYAFDTRVATSTAILADTPDPSPPGASYDVQVGVTRTSGSDAVSGNVVVGDGTTSCVAPLSGAGATAAGSCRLSPAGTGVRQITATYGGDAVYAGSSAAAVEHRIVGANAPGAPRIGAAQAGNAGVSVAFDPPLDPGGAPVVGYTATCGAASASGPTSPIGVAGLPNGVPVTCTVRAANAVGAGAASAESNSVTPATAPNAPTTVVATRGNAYLSVAFAAPADTGGLPIASYTVLCGAAGATGAASPIVVRSLALGVPVSCRVIARHAAGQSPLSAPSNAVTPAAVPGAPTGATATRGNRQVGVAFQPPGDDGGDAITSYTAHCGAASATGTASPIVVGGLANGTPVACTVAATNGIGNGPPSAPSASVVPADVPDAPTLTTAAAGSGTATLVFAAPANDGGAAVTSYVASCTPGTHTATGAASPLRIFGLDNGTKYSCVVSAVNEIGQSAASNSVVVMPVASVDLAITNDNAADHVRGGATTSYLIEVTNASAVAVTGARVRDALDPRFSDASWVCTGENGGTCPAANGVGHLDALVDLPPGARVGFLLTATLAPLPETPIANTATVSAPAAIVDPNAANDAATDGPDTVVLFRSGFQ